ncbi:hypothetical protein AGABI1DRAFT_125724 [Agaricus bisporus var. burnettii JB137-S8]|uniref:F-box domain-containing protein n=1 Tax=Agaricus bisporus var. burnettii (strain JB137-S8 / ATCC MYA-4627 / FGSC 10392) TaxID=597362 RepID=K5XIV8_AGABU|nr:uncharacterized protein AGABI1DRAFT_125724 [Agaricus bisporus var. burnettii JB137-S8]EKM83262.1 hypothetical protein AGABI1DRAFT_125724 [Agaricus bisporus var. burnettii JB137-S8]
MPDSNLLDLPSGVFLYIVDFLKGLQVSLTPLRLVCRSFNVYVCEAMFDTLVINGGPCRDPFKWQDATWSSDLWMYYINRLHHQLDTLYTKKQPAALRRAKRLKIFVSGVFGCPGTRMSDIIEHEEGQSAIHNLTIKLPPIIQTLENLRETTICLSNFEIDAFTRDISNALLTLPHLSTLNIIFLDHNSFKPLPIVESPHLATVKMTWPLHEANTSIPTRLKGSSSIYCQLFGATTQNTKLKRLELRSTNKLRPQVELYQLGVFPNLEKLVIDNVPVMLNGDVIKEMKSLQSLRLAYGRSACSNNDPCVEVWKFLKEFGRKLKRLSVDTIGESLLSYLHSYQGLEALELTLGGDTDSAVDIRDLFEQGLRHHEESFKSLQVSLHTHSNPLSPWFFEYWKEWIPSLKIMENLEVTTSMNLFSNHDASVLVKNITDVVALIPTLQTLTIRHLYERHPLFTHDNGITRVVLEGVQSTQLNRNYTAIPQCVVAIHDLQRTFHVILDHGEGRYGSLKLVCNHFD